MVPTVSGNGNYLFIIDAGKFARRNVPRYERRLLPSTVRRNREYQSHAVEYRELIDDSPTLQPVPFQLTKVSYTLFVTLRL